MNGPRPSEVKIYYAKTLPDNRRDFRLVVGAPNDPTKAVPHPVVWLNTNDSLIINETPTKITYRAAFIKPRK